MNDNEKLMLLFECGNESYAIACNDVVEVIPAIDRGKTVGYHGTAIPLADFSAMLTGKAAPPLLSTRIILLSAGEKGRDAIVGLVAEKVLHTEKYPESVFIEVPSTMGLSCQQIVTEQANVPVIDPAAILAAIRKSN